MDCKQPEPIPRRFKGNASPRWVEKREREWEAYAAELEEEIDDLHTRLEIRDDAAHRAIKLWRDNGGSEMEMPDLAKLIGWLLEKLAACGICPGPIRIPAETDKE